jgi:chaperonin GroES
MFPSSLQASAARRVIPLLDRVLVQRLVAPTKSIGGVILPDSVNTRLNEVRVCACGSFVGFSIATA